ncbi:MAG: hypothetical protein ACI4DP_02135 [Candidatus Ornithomonoglobus sp.]
MGGKEGNRGYIYQAIVSIIKACTKDGWDSISVECKTPEDKVDIALFDSGNNVQVAIQVKFSVNLFEVSDMKEWIKSIVDDIKADSYQLYLIGNCGKKANTFIKSIDKFYSDEFDEETKKALDGFISVLENKNISIVLLPFDEEHLLSVIKDNLNRFISSMGNVTDYNTLEELSMALISISMLWGTKGKKINRKEYINNIKKWIEVTANGNLRTAGYYSSLNLYSYDFAKEEIIPEFGFRSIDVNYSFSEEIAGLLEKGRVLIKQISSIELPSYIKMDDEDVFVPDEMPETATLEERIKRVRETKAISLEMRQEQKQKMSEDIERYWDIRVSDGFYHVGNLKSSNFFAMCSDNIIYGTEEEKNKNDLIDKLRGIIHQLNIIDIFDRNIKQLYFIPLCISNDSTMSDTDVTVSLDLKKSRIQLFDFNSNIIESEKELLGVIAEHILKKDFIKKVFSAKENSIISVDVNETVILESYEYHLPFYSIEYDYDDLVDRFALYQAKEDETGKVNYEIENLRAGEIKWLAPFVFTDDANGEYEIAYSILSKNIGKRATGTIIVKGYRDENDGLRG